jgi:hypothetical protein
MEDQNKQVHSETIADGRILAKTMYNILLNNRKQHSL